MTVIHKITVDSCGYIIYDVSCAAVCMEAFVDLNGTICAMIDIATAGKPGASSDWDPGLYMKFADERIRPSTDLVARIDIENPKSIIDIGCGPGNSTQILHRRWPASSIAGIDNSPAMIEKARRDSPEQNWILGDASKMDHVEKYDIVFSNATIQWIPDHERLIPKLMDLVAEKGALAVQIPLYQLMPISGLIETVASQGTWKATTRGCMGLFTFHERGFYYDLLVHRCRLLEIWETSYIHVMNTHGDILEMIKSTGMRPYLELIESDKDKKDFEIEVLKAIEQAYPAQRNGRVLFPFKRLFFIAYR